MVHQDGDVRIVGDGLGHQAGVHGGAGVSQLPTAVVAGGSQFLKGGTPFGTGCRSIGHTFDLGRFGTVVRKHQSGCVLLAERQRGRRGADKRRQRSGGHQRGFAGSGFGGLTHGTAAHWSHFIQFIHDFRSESDYGAAFRQLCHSHGLSGMGAPVRREQRLG